jgi:universal stress protein A
MVGIERILCPVDLSDCSRTALTHALALSRWYEAKLTVLHVFRQVAAIETAAARLESHAHERLETLVPKAARAYCSVHTEVTEGHPANEILRFVRDRHADLVVMGVRGRDALDVALLGSQTRAVVHEAQCPVLTVRQG